MPEPYRGEPETFEDWHGSLERLGARACDWMIRPPDWSPARDIDICGRCGLDLGAHAARQLAKILEIVR